MSPRRPMTPRSRVSRKTARSTWRACAMCSSCARSSRAARRPARTSTSIRVITRRRWRGCNFPSALILSTRASKQPLQLGAEFRRDVVAIERVGDVGGEESDLRAAVVGAPVELVAVERRGLHQRDHRVGELDLAAGALLLMLQDAENFRLQ